MTPIKNVSFKFRCSEDINKMTSSSSGKYCSSCNKTVIDFRTSETSQLINKLMGQSEVCGIFFKEQVNIKSQLKRNITFYKRYAFGILVSLGITIFSKESFAQNSTPDSSKTVNKPSEYENAYFGGVSEILPQYRGGNDALIRFVKNNINYPKGVEGKVFVTFVIDTLGKVTEPSIIRSLSAEADKEALRIVNLLEFYPGIQNGKLKSYSYSIPILFNVEK